MTKVAQFSSYVGLVVLISAAILLSPRATVAAWATVSGWVRSRAQDVVAWRPRTVRAEPPTLPVEIHVGARFGRDDPEVLEAGAPEGIRRALQELCRLSRDVVEAAALALAVVAVLVRSADQVVDLVPDPAVFAGDMLLVLATFLVMQRIIRDYPAELLPSIRFPRRAHPGRTPAERVRRTGRLDHALELVVLALGLLVMLAWPSQLGMYLGELRFGSARAGLVVGWAIELPWLLAVALVLLREKAEVRASSAVVLTLALRPVASPVEERQAA